MEIPKLKLPSKNFSQSSAYAASHSENTFAGKMRSFMNAYEKEHKLHSEYSYDSYTTDSQKRNLAQASACHATNEYFDNMRCAIALEMQKYILEHDGVIDSWCDSASEFVHSFANDQKTQYKFDYFGSDYVSERDSVERETTDLIYRNAYQYPGTDEFISATKLEEELIHYAVNDTKKESLASITLDVVGMLYFAFGALSILADVFFNFGSILESFLNEHLIALILELPYLAYFMIKGIAGDVRNATGIFFIIIIMGVCIFLFNVFFHLFKESYGKYMKVKRAQKEMDDLKESGRYDRIMAENDELRKPNEELAEQCTALGMSGSAA